MPRTRLSRSLMVSGSVVALLVTSAGQSLAGPTSTDPSTIPPAATSQFTTSPSTLGFSVAEPTPSTSTSPTKPSAPATRSTADQVPPSDPAATTTSTRSATADSSAGTGTKTSADGSTVSAPSPPPSRPALTSAPNSPGPARRLSTAANCIVIPSTAANATPLTSRAQLGDDEDDPLWNFLTDLLSDAADTPVDGGAGWVLDLLLGNNPGGDKSDPQLQSMLAAQSKQLTAIQNQLSSLAGQLTGAEYALKAQLAKSTYDTLVSQSQLGIGLIQSWTSGICALNASVTDPTVTKPYTPDTGDLNLINDIRDGALSALDALSDELLGSGAGSDGIIATYRNAYWATLQASTGQPPSTAIWTGAYLQSMHALQDYYLGLAVGMFNAYVEAVHWDTPNSSPALPAEHADKISQFYAQLNADVLAWTQAATSDLPAVPTDHAVDARTGDVTKPGSTYNLWTITPTTLPGTNSSQYCAHPASLCVFNQWDPAAADTSVAAGRIVPAVEPLATYLVTGAGGYSGWHIPASSDWTNLVKVSKVAGTNTTSGLDPNDGVAAWAAAEQIPVLSAQQLTDPAQKLVSTIPPVVVADPTAQVLTFNNPTSATPTAPLPPASQGYAGNLALETSLTAATPPIPAVPPTARNRVGNSPAAAAVPTRLTRDDHHVDPVAQAAPATGGTASLRGTLNTATTFDTPGACTNNSYTQPRGANAVQVTVQGARGGSGSGNPAGNNRGGYGGQVTTTIPLQVGATIHIQVGGSGANAYTKINGSGGGAGGSGGGATGGSDLGNTVGGSPTNGGAGGGGGFSGISADSTCNQWLTIAGGGGGGGESTGSQTENYPGGNGCPDTTCSAPTPTTDHGGSIQTRGGGAGGSIPGGGAAGNNKGFLSGAGTSGTRLAGGAGGQGTNGCGQCTFMQQTAGGGGGGGWGGGGGGGGSVNGYSGAGGAGGGSYVIPGVGQRSFSATSPGPGGSVTITPVVAPEYSIGTSTAAQLPPTTTVLTDTNNVQTGDQLVRQQPVPAASNQSWATLLAGNDAAANQFYLLQNIAHPNDCVIADGEQPGAAVATTICSMTAEDQAWRFSPQPADSWSSPAPNSGPPTITTYWNSTISSFADTGLVVAAIPSAGQPAALAAAPTDSTNASAGARWNLLIDPQLSIWALPTDPGGLTHLISPPPATHSPSTVKTRPTTTATPVLANTGPGPLQMATQLCLLLLISGLTLAVVGRRRRRNSTH